MALPCLYVQFLRCALLQRPHPPTIGFATIIDSLYNSVLVRSYIIYATTSYINKRETPKTCLTNHKGSVSHHITPLVINSLGGGHTHTDIADKSNFKTSLWLARACGLKM